MKNQIEILDTLAKRCRKQLYITNTPYKKQIKRALNNYNQAKKIGKEVKKNAKPSL